jgi:hypothetical protein
LIRLFQSFLRADVEPQAGHAPGVEVDFLAKFLDSPSTLMLDVSRERQPYESNRIGIEYGFTSARNEGGSVYTFWRFEIQGRTTPELCRITPAIPKQIQTKIPIIFAMPKHCARLHIR